MPNKKDKPAKYPQHATKAKEIIAPLSNMKRKAIAEAAGLTRSQLSKLTGGEQRVTLEIEGRLKDVVRQFSGQGFAESATEFTSSTDRKIHNVPEYPCTAAPDGEWRIAFFSPCGIRQLDSDLPESAELFAIKAPDNTAAPRYRKGELIILARNISPGVGDDALLCKREVEHEHTGYFGELLRSTQTDFRLRQYCDPETPLERDLRRWTVFASVPIT